MSRQCKGYLHIDVSTTEHNMNKSDYDIDWAGPRSAIGRAPNS